MKCTAIIAAPRPPAGIAESELLHQGFGTVTAGVRGLNNLAVSEGPSGGHYQNLSAPTQNSAAARSSAPGLTLVMDFR